MSADEPIVPSVDDAPRLYRAAGVMTIGTALSRITGLVRLSAMTAALGVTAGKLADTYNLANTTPNIVYELFLGGILTSVFVPVLIDARERKRGDESALVTVSLLALAVIAILAAVGAPLIMRIYTFRIADPVLRAQQLELATFLLRWFAPQIFFYGLSAIAEALLNVRGRFAPPKFAPVLNNLVVAGTLLVFAQIVSRPTLELDTAARTLLGAGTTAGVVLQAIVLLPFLRGERLRPRFDLRDPAVQSARRLSVFVIGYVAVNQIGLWVVLALANGVRGGVTAWQVAFIFFQLPHGLFAVSLHSALFPDLARAAGTGDWGIFRQRLQTALRGVMFMIAPAAIGYAVLAHPITRLIVAHGIAEARDAAAVANVLRVLVAGLVFFSISAMFVRAFYALQDTRTPTMLNAGSVVVQIALSFPLFAWVGVRGLALAHASSYAVGVVLQAIVLGRRVPGGLQLRELVTPLVRIAAAAAGMGACVLGLSSVVGGSDLVVVGAGVGAGAILYLAFSQVARVDERRMVLHLLRARPRRRLEGGERS
jgi:putative peptidoglycan lipid II flippase